MPHSLTLALSTWVLVARILLRRKGKVSLMAKRNTESVEIEKQQKKEVFYMQAKRYHSSTARSAEAGIDKYSPFQLHLNQAKRCHSSTARSALRLTPKLFHLVIT